MQDGHKIELDGSPVNIKPNYLKINYLTYRLEFQGNHFDAAWAVLGFLCLSIAPWALCKPVSILDYYIEAYTSDKEPVNVID